MGLQLLACASGCTNEPTTEDAYWEVLLQEHPGALLSVWGASANDVWVVGSDALDGSGPTILHVEDGDIERVDSGEDSCDVWWVHGFADGPVYMGGSNGLILRYQNGAITKMPTPGNGTIFGMWGASATDMWAVGGASEVGGGFAWRLQGEEWVDEPSLPAEVPQTGAIWKIHGTSERNAWLVGSNGLAFHWNGQLLEPADTGVGSSLFTVFGEGELFAAVGGLVSGVIVEHLQGQWVDATPDPPPDSLSGVSLGRDGTGFAVGAYGSVYRRGEAGWERESLGFSLNESLHGVWVDPNGDVWAVGGRTYAPPLGAGILLRRHTNP